MSTELALPIGYTNALCELKTLGNDLLTTGVIRKIGPDFLEITNAMGSSSLKFYVDEVKVVITHKKLPDRVFIGRLYIPTMEFFRVIDVKSVMGKDLRNFFRVNVYLPAIVVAPNEDKDAKEITNKYEVMVVDLSLGGCYLTTEASILPMTEVLLILQLDSKRVEVKTQIKRRMELPNGMRGYGCAFVGLKNVNADAVVKYLFKKQKEVRI